MPRFFSPFAGLVVAPLVVSCAHAQERPARTPASTPADARRDLAAFDALGLPSVAGRELVVFDSGCAKPAPIDANGAIAFNLHRGWIVSETATAITLLEPDLDTHTYRIDPTLPPEWEAHREKHPVDMPLPGHHLPVDFERWANEALDAKEEATFGGWRSGLSQHGRELVVLARWALERKLDALAVRLVERVRADFESKQHASEALGRDAKPETFGNAVATSLAQEVWFRAIQAAHAGAPRAKLLDLWKKIAKLPENAKTAEARSMIDAYEKLLAEDATWKERPIDAVKKLPVPEQVAYWIHALRDVDARQWCQPGECSVLGPLACRGDRARPNPAEELVAIGWPAIPELIAHLEDARPTRSLGYWRDFAPDSYYLLKYGDACQQILEAIAGEGFYERGYTNGYPTKDDKAAGIKAAAQAWWEREGKLGPEKATLALLEHGSADEKRFAAGKLLGMDAKRFRPVVVDAIQKASGYDRVCLLWAMDGHLQPEDMPMLLELLEDRDARVAIVAAWDAWTVGHSDAGVPVAIRLLDAWKEGDDDLVRMNGVGLLANVRNDLAVEKLCACFRDPRRQVRYDAIHAAASAPDRRVAVALAALLDDTTDTGWTGAGGKIRYCDHAAETLAQLVHYPDAPSVSTTKPMAERDAGIATLRAWWDAHANELDWKKLAEPAK